jgi:type I site-specific restriction endonuclease
MSSSISAKSTKASVSALATQLIAGIQKHLANVTSFTVASAAYTPAEVTTALQQLVAIYGAVNAARSVVTAKLTEEKAQTPALRSTMAALMSYVKLTFGGSPEVLADFGLQPKKVATKLTTEKQVVAVARRASTRKARGTTGKRAKLAVKGNVVDVALTPIEAAPPATPSAATSAPVTSGSATGGATPHGA